MGVTGFDDNILGRYFCNTLEEALKSTESKPFDVVIIGAGMYGSYIASKLYYWSKQKDQLGFDRRLKILILEAGPYLIYEHIENLPQKTGNFLGSVEKSPYICNVQRGNDQPIYFGEVTKHSYCVGGKSLSWGKWSPRLTEEALNLWPSEAKDFLLNHPDGYQRVEDETGTSDRRDLIKGNLFNGLEALFNEKLYTFSSLELWKTPVAVAAGNTISGLYSPDAFSSLGFLLENVRIESDFPDVGTPPNIKSIFLVPNSLVYNLETMDGRVTHINLVNSESNEKKVIELANKCDVVLAGTAIESTRLALHSFPRSRALKEESELIGRNLMGHLFTTVKARIKRTALNFLKDENIKKEILETALFHIQGRSHKFKKDYHFQFFCNADPNFDVFTTLYKMFYDLEVAIDTLNKSQDPEWVTLLVFTCSEMKGKPKDPVYSTGSSWMDLSQNQSEKFGDLQYPKPYLNWESSLEDEEFWDEVHATLFDFLESLVNPGEIEYSIPNSSPEWTINRPTSFDDFQISKAFWDSRHEMGTLWMGENSNTSITDLDGKFHHIQNVYCADHGLFPAAGSANPTLTGLTLNRKVARAIIDRYKDVEAISAKKFEEDGFKPLFDGTSKSWNQGWQIQKKGKYLILFDEILELSKNGDSIGVAWYNLQEFSKFELNVEWKVFDYDANSGIIIHAPNPASFSEDGDADIYRRGYEIQIDERGYNHYKGLYGSPLHKTGAIYSLSPANRGNAKKPGLWNRFRIISSDNEITVSLNNEPISHLNSLDRNKSGYICLQFHSKIVQFRNIMIKEL